MIFIFIYFLVYLSGRGYIYDEMFVINKIKEFIII